MHDLAIISKIQSITPIEGKDRIVLAKVENYDTIIQKDDFKVGDTCIYVFYDAILPVKPEFEFLRKRCYSEKWQGFRIRPMKMGGVVSEGLVLPLSVLPSNKKYKLGQIVTDELGIRLYDPEALLESQNSKKKNPLVEWLLKFVWFRKIYRKFFSKKKTKEGYPVWIDKSDEENIEKCYNNVAKYPDIEYIVSEKMEGCLREDTLIQTPDGLKTIKSLCDENYHGKVLSYNSITGETEYKKCLGTLIREPDNKKWYKVETEEGDTLYLTENHPIFNPDLNIYREAKNCKVGDTVLIENT